MNLNFKTWKEKSAPFEKNNDSGEYNMICIYKIEMCTDNIRVKRIQRPLDIKEEENMSKE